MESNVSFISPPPNHAMGNLKGNCIKVSSFSKCNDLFELASVSLSEQETRKRHRDWIADTNNKFGLICLSEDWRNPLMWGHYTDSGTGLCLVLDVVAANLQKVNYVGRRITSGNGFSFPTSYDNDFREFCATKSYHWAYEKEQRYFVNLKKNNSNLKDADEIKLYLLGSTINLVGIINGPHPEHSEKEIRCAVGDGVKYIQCRPAFREFKMVSQQNKKLWK